MDTQNMLRRQQKLMPSVHTNLAGFPCQPESTQGNRSMANPALAGVIRYVFQSKPLSFIIENAKGLTVGKKQRRRFDRMLRLLRRTRIVHWTLFSPHKGGGLAQHRPRVFVVGLRRDANRAQSFQNEWVWPQACECKSLLSSSQVSSLRSEVLPQGTVADRSIGFMRDRIREGILQLTAPIVVDLAASKK